jgi:hypothetical protein
MTNLCARKISLLIEAINTRSCRFVVENKMNIYFTVVL